MNIEWKYMWKLDQNLVLNITQQIQDEYLLEVYMWKLDYKNMMKLNPYLNTS